MVYLPLLEETGHVPTEKYAHAPEILAHCRRIGRHFGLYDDALFQTEVTDLAWDDGRSRWIVRTNRGDAFTAQFVGIGTGPLHVPSCPASRASRRSPGHSFHTSRWDYAYTGGDPLGAPMTSSPTSASASSAPAPPPCSACPTSRERRRSSTSSSARPRRSTSAPTHRPIPSWFAAIATPGWQQRWLENFTANQAGGTADGGPGAGRLDRPVAPHPPARSWRCPRSSGRARACWPRSRTPIFEKMEEIRARVDAIVADPATAQALKAWYRQLCKRPCFHDDYLQAFNLPSVHLVDTDGKGVERITAGRRGRGRRGVSSSTA